MNNETEVLNQIIIEWKKGHPDIRLGQHFCNNYIKGQWPLLYYSESYKFCYNSILSWLQDHQYTTSLPQKITRE